MRLQHGSDRTPARFQPEGPPEMTVSRWPRGRASQLRDEHTPKPRRRKGEAACHATGGAGPPRPGIMAQPCTESCPTTGMTRGTRRPGRRVTRREDRACAAMDRHDLVLGLPVGVTMGTSTDAEALQGYPAATCGLRARPADGGRALRRKMRERGTG
ncbi:MAG TPA: hypothetical protein DEF41_02065 [Desulfovibrio sp.]|nr:hypothetical protein [Desulfovibrio sp.]